VNKQLLLTRREFVVTSISAVAGAVLPAEGWAQVLPEVGYSDVKKKILSVFNHSESMKFIGKKYIEQVPVENKASILLAPILFGGSDTRFQNTVLLNQKEIKSFIRSRVKEDFISGQTVSIRGWVLAKTEARLCALAFLGN